MGASGIVPPTFEGIAPSMALQDAFKNRCKAKGFSTEECEAKFIQRLNKSKKREMPFDGTVRIAPTTEAPGS
jgi:hypothetical protein